MNNFYFSGKTISICVRRTRFISIDGKYFHPTQQFKREFRCHCNFLFDPANFVRLCKQPVLDPNRV